jgi:hypothetical protein
MTKGKQLFLVISGCICFCLFVIVLELAFPSITSLSFGKHQPANIHLWVKYVDQEGKGVSNYKCQITTQYTGIWALLLRKSVNKIFQADSNGFIEYDSKWPASAIYIGLVLPKQWCMNPGYLMQTYYIGVTRYEYLSAMNKDRNNYLGSKSNPYIINVLKTGAPQNLLYWKHNVILKNPEAYACVDILGGRIWESDRPEGDIAMKDGKYTTEGEPPCIISIVAGDSCWLYPVIDDWGLEPPEEGYTKNLCWGKDWYDKRTRTINIIQYYYMLQAKNGKTVFGKISFGLSPRVQGAEIECYTNLHGERNLFYKGYVRDYDPLPGPIQNFISPPVTWEEILEGKYKKLTEMKKEGGNVDERDYKGQTALIKAATSGKKEVCEYLIEKGARIYEKDFKGESALLKAVEYGHKEITELLISKGADANDSNSENVTVLMRAAGRGDKGICELLISKGADINARDNDGRTALMYAVWAGQREVCEFLISKGADVNKRDNNGKTALKIAKDSNHISIILYLKSIGGKE